MNINLPGSGKNNGLIVEQQIVEFSVFDVLGDGIIPTVYWVDNYNRVIFIVSGVEAYVLSCKPACFIELIWR